MIDSAMPRAQFSAFPPKLVQRLLTATEADMIKWGNHLIAAWEDGDTKEIDRARHAAGSLCGNFGAHRLLTLSEMDLSAPGARESYLETLSRTLHAIRVVALGVISNAD